MRTSFRFLPLVGLCALGLTSPALAEGTHPFSVKDMLAMERISDPRVSPDGRLAAFTVRVTDMEANKGRTDIHLLDLTTREVRRLTANEASDTNPRFAADGKSLYFLSTRSGSGQVWRLPLNGGEPEQITREPLDIDDFEVSPDGKSLVLAMAVFPGKSPAETKQELDTREKSKRSGKVYDRLMVRHWDTWKDGTRNHVFVFPLPGGPAKDLMPAMDADAPSKPFGGLDETALSADGKTLIFTAKDEGTKEAWSTNYDLFSVPADGAPTVVGASAAAGASPPKRITQNPAWDTSPRFSPDGKSLAYLAMSRAGYEADRYRIVVRELASGKERSIDLRVDDGKFGDRSPQSLSWSEDGKELITTADHLGQKALFATDVATGKSRIVVGEGSVESPQTVKGGRILYGLHSLLGPTELYLVPLSGGKPEKLTGINDARVASAQFGQPEQFTFTGAKNEKVYGYVVKPAGFDPAKKYPVAFLVHGGPQGSFGNDFHYRWNPQFYAGAGYAAVMIDFHGSTGYGQAFTDAINGDWGGAPYEDLMKGLDFALKKYSFLDPNRMCALGASYGGYMINWIAGQTNRFKALVVHSGNLDERMAYYDTEELWFPEWEHGGLPWDPKTTYTKHNPIDHVSKWKTPTLVVHGMKDFRVVYVQGLSTFTALQRQGVPSRLLVFPDENHWVAKPNNSQQWHETVLEWIDRYCKPAAK
ncbi:MAG: S9 family peptidase [Acidobacteria bacterium]|nr:S9 family peptidase [Acidobacteriota bacterium]